MDDLQALKENTRILVSKDNVTAISTLKNNRFYLNGEWVSEHTFVGVARLKENDIYDEAVATRIASSKLERNYHKVMKNTYIQILKEKQKEFDDLVDAIDKHTDCCESITRHIIETTSFSGEISNESTLNEI